MDRCNAIISAGGVGEARVTHSCTVWCVVFIFEQQLTCNFSPILICVHAPADLHVGGKATFIHTTRYAILIHKNDERSA